MRRAALNNLKKPKLIDENLKEKRKNILLSNLLDIFIILLFFENYMLPSHMNMVQLSHFLHSIGIPCKNII